MKVEIEPGWLCALVWTLAAVGAWFCVTIVAVLVWAGLCGRRLDDEQETEDARRWGA